MYGPIELTSTAIIIHNYNMGDNPVLENQFLYYEKQYQKRVPKFLGIKYDYKNKTLYVPGGSEFYNVLPSINISDNMIIRIPPYEYEYIDNVLLKIQPRDERQKEAIRFCLGLEEYNSNRHKSQISVNLDTGVGKTYVAIFVFAFYKVRTIMITSVINWLDQWKDRILQYTNLTDEEVYIINGSSSIYKLLNNIKDVNKIKFYLVSHNTLNSYGKTNGWNSIGDLFRYLKIGIKIYDEAHLNFDNMCKIDYFSNVWKTYYLTATPMKSKPQENKIYQNAFKTVPKISLFDKDIDPHTIYTALFFNSHPRPGIVEKCIQYNYGFSSMRYIEYFANTEYFYKMLDLVLYMYLNAIDVNKGEKILIYIGKNEVIMKAYYYIKYYYPFYSIGIFTSLKNTEEKYEELNNTIILTTTGSSKACLDIPGLKKTIIFAEPFNSPVYAKQILGRTRDDNTEMIELIDIGFRPIINWYHNKLNKIYRKYAMECNTVQFRDEDINNITNQIVKNRNTLIDQTNLKPIVTITKK